MSKSLWENVFHRTKKDSIEYVVERTKLFEGLHRKDLHELIKLGHLRNFKVGETLFKKGEPSFGIYIVLKGRVEIYLPGKKKTILTHFHQGDFFGELSLVKEDKRTASADATEPCTLFYLFHNDLRKLFKRRPFLGLEILERVLHIMAIRMENVDRRLK